MVQAEDRWSVRATRGPVLVVLALASLASFGRGFIEQGGLTFSTPQGEPQAYEAVAAAPLPPAPVTVAAAEPKRPAARTIMTVAPEGAPEAATAEEKSAAAEVLDAPPPAPALVEPAAPPQLATAPAAVDSAQPAAEVAPDPAEPIEEEPPPV